MEARERRRWLTDRSAKHKQHIYRTQSWSWYAEVRDYARAAVAMPWLPLLGRLRKGKSIGCDCRHRCHGRPKFGCGICVRNGYRPAVVERIAGRRECRRWLCGDED